MDTLRVYFVTWNVATKSPGQDLNSLLDFPSQFNKNKPLPDFYVIGLQEVKSQPQNMLMDSLFTDPWTSTFNKILCRQGYIIAKSIRLQGILLLVYTQMKHVTHLREIEAQYTKTGLGGMWGNKGAVSVRFNIYGCSVCFVNCHLAAHEHLLADRISDYNDIIKQHLYHVGETSNILYHDYVFWLGDLNFRTDHPSGSSPTSEEIVMQLQKVEKDKYSSLLMHDQLMAVMDTGEAFSEFTEPEIRFPPTYKFNIGTDDYDLKRKPSWTDRILYKVVANNYENVTLRADLVSYNSLQHYSVSDHKPVVAQYNIKIRNDFARSIATQASPILRSSIQMRSLILPPMNQGGTLIEPTEGECTLRSSIQMRSLILPPMNQDGTLIEPTEGECTCDCEIDIDSDGIPPVSEETTDGVARVDKDTEEHPLPQSSDLKEHSPTCAARLVFKKPDVERIETDGGEPEFVVPYSAYSMAYTETGSEDGENAAGEQDAIDAPEQAFSNYTVKTVEFAPISRIWYVGDADFRTQCTLSPDVEVNPNDWIGIYDANFHSLDDYIAYEYLAKVSLPAAPPSPGRPRVITLSFPVGSGVRTPGFYRFIYFSQINSDVRSVLGISEPFEVSSKDDKLDIDISEPCSSAAADRAKPSSATSDIFTDFSVLDVANLSRHFSNDLSID